MTKPFYTLSQSDAPPAGHLPVGDPPSVVPIHLALLVAEEAHNFPVLLVHAAACALKQSADESEQFLAANPGRRGNGGLRHEMVAMRKQADRALMSVMFANVHLEIAEVISNPARFALDAAQWVVLSKMSPTWKLGLAELTSAAQDVQPPDGSPSIDLLTFARWKARELLSIHVRRLQESESRLSSDLRQADYRMQQWRERQDELRAALHAAARQRSRIEAAWTQAPGHLSDALRYITES